MNENDMNKTCKATAPLTTPGASISGDPYTIVGDRWSDLVGAAEGTTTGTSVEGEVSAVGNADASYCRFFLTRLRTGECFQLVGKDFFVGKSREATYQLRGTDTISRMHVCFHIDGDECWIEDNQSLNGTMVDGVRIAPHCRVSVRSGSRIRLSDEDFLLETKVM